MKNKIINQSAVPLYDRAVINLADLEKNAVEISWQISKGDKKSTDLLSAIENRLDIKNLLTFNADLKLEQLARGEYFLSGTWSAGLIEVCVMTLEDLECYLNQSLYLDFISKGIYDNKKHQDCEIIEGEQIDVFEQLVQELSLHRDPFPKKEGSQLKNDMMGIKENQDGSKNNNRPFANLSQLLEKKQREQKIKK